jgi:hypothetical protein
MYKGLGPLMQVYTHTRYCSYKLSQRIRWDPWMGHDVSHDVGGRARSRSGSQGRGSQQSMCDQHRNPGARSS